MFTFSNFFSLIFADSIRWQFLTDGISKYWWEITALNWFLISIHFPLAQSYNSESRPAEFVNFLWFFTISTRHPPISGLPPNGHRSIHSCSIFDRGFPSTGDTPRRIQHNTLVFHGASSFERILLTFIYLFNANRFFLCRRVCFCSLFEASLFFIFMCCIFKDIISLILVGLVEFIKIISLHRKICLYLTKTLFQKKNRIDEIVCRQSVLANFWKFAPWRGSYLWRVLHALSTTHGTTLAHPPRGPP